MQRTLRMKREVVMLSQNPPPGVSCWQNENDIFALQAQILGAEGTPYNGGTFLVDITIPERYPFEPPNVQFKTPIYHPNIDASGRICLDTLKMPPQGAWKPSLNISSVLTTIQLLLSEPNPDDPLMADIANEYKFDRPMFALNAKKWTKKHASTSCAQKLLTPTNNDNLKSAPKRHSEDEKCGEKIPKLI